MPWNTEAFISSAVSVAAGWLAASVTKVSKAEHKEVVTRLEALEKDVSSRMTRAEFVEAFGEVKILVREFRNETRSEFKELKIELKSKT